MRLVWISLIAVVLCVGAVSAQQPTHPAKPDPKPAAKPDPNSLEALIGDALRTHPDIRVAEAKVRDAEALLSQARFKVIQDVSNTDNAVAQARATLAVLEIVMKKTKDLFDKNFTTDLELANARLDVERAAAELAKREADLNLLVGRSAVQQHFRTYGDVGAFFADEIRQGGSERVVDPRTGKVYRTYVGALELLIDTKVTSGTMSDKIRTALKTPIKIDRFNERVPLADVIEYLKDKAKIDIPIRIHVASGPKAAGTVDLVSGELPLSAWLAMIEDSVPDLVFVVREYGLLATVRDRVPEDALRLQEFLRRTEPKKEEPKK